MVHNENHHVRKYMIMKGDKKQDRYRGAFLGMAIGDALGAPAQGLKPARIVQLFGTINDYLESDVAFEAMPSHWRLKGLYSLPTQQALTAAESLILSAGYNLKDIFDIFKSMAACEGTPDIFRGINEHFRKALERLKHAGEPLGNALPYPGITEACRILPLALHFRNDETSLMRAAIECALLTGNDHRAVAGAAAYAFSASSLAGNPEVVMRNCSEFATNLLRFTRKSEEVLQDEYGRYLPGDLTPATCYEMSEALSILSPCLREKNPELVQKTILAEANRLNPPFPISSPNQDFAPSAVTFVIYTALSAPNFRQGIVRVIMQGKEACAMGALAGGLLGLRFGEEGMPDEWRKGLMNADEVAMRGNELANGFPNWSERTDLVSLESELSRRDEEERRKRREAAKQAAAKRERRHPPKSQTAAKPQLPPQEEAPFAPPPWVVFGEPFSDPITKKKEKSLRGRRRIGWKEKRNRKNS